MKKTYRVIFHIDLNAFFASCEMAQDPSLKDVPLGIGGRSDRGVLTTANYVAREYGVTSAMSVYEAKKRCPNLVILPVNFELYHHYSEQFFKLLHEYADEVEKGSIDEGYIDVTDLSEEKHPLDIAKEIQGRLLDEYKLPVSIGIAPNMFLAKMASDMKKPLGITVLIKRDIKEKMWPLPIKEMYGIGKKTYPDLIKIGIQTIGDLVQYDDKRKLQIVLGNRMEEFIDKAHGIDDRKVDPHRHIDMKSIGNSQTYSTDLQTYQEIIEKLSHLTRKVVNRLQDDGSVAKTINIQVRYPDFSQINRSYTLESYTNNYFDVYNVVERLYDENQSDLPVRLLGVSVSNMIPESEHVEQMTIYDIEKNLPKEEKVLKIINSINNVYGQKIIKKGTKK